MRQKLFLACAIAALFAAQTLFVALYLSAEKTVHFWDYAMYADMAVRWFALENPSAQLAVFADSFSYHYNLLFALPSLVSFSLFGPSRFVFILTNAVVFLFLSQASFALFLRKILGGSFSGNLSFALGLSWLVPIFWIPLVQGYPDHASVLCLGLACLFALKARRSWRENAALGAVLALSVIFRRHFAYAGLALLCARFVLDLADLRKEETKFFLVSWGVVCLTGLAFLLSVEPLYVKSMLSVDFTALYEAYRRAPAEIPVYVVSRLGLVLLVIACTGYALFRRASFARLFLLFGFFWLVLWSFGPAQFGEHYLLAVWPLFCVVGLAAFFKSVAPSSVKKAAALLLVAHVCFVFWPRTDFPLPSDPSLIGPFASARPPWTRPDMGALFSLAAYLRNSTSPQDRIAIVSSSFVFNQDLLGAVYRDYFKDPTPLFRFVPVPEIDGTQEPAFDALASANIYVVPNAPQLHLPARGQKNAVSLWTILSSGWPESFQLKKDPQEFSLMRGVTLSVYRRAPWTGSALHEKLAGMREGTAALRPWVITTGAPFVEPRKNGSFAGRLFPLSPRASLFYDAPLGSGEYRLALRLDHESSCSGILIVTRLESARGIPLYEKRGRFLSTSGIYVAPFLIKDGEKNAFLFVSLESSEGEACFFRLPKISLERLARTP